MVKNSKSPKAKSPKPAKATPKPNNRAVKKPPKPNVSKHTKKNLRTQKSKKTNFTGTANNISRILKSNNVSDLKGELTRISEKNKSRPISNIIKIIRK